MKTFSKAFIALALTLAAITLIPSPTPVSAADLSKFDPGHIIDDEIFYDKDTMTVKQIQAFLNSKVPKCETYSDKYVKTYEAAPCLKDYTETTNTKSADKYCKGYGAVKQTAAEIIHGVAQSCGVNPQVLLVILQKEQALVTDTWPRDSWMAKTKNGVNFQYRSAMGYGCPDTAACDKVFYGFFNQVYHAASQFHRYRLFPTDYSYVAGKNNNIPWHPNRSKCGTSKVFIQNQATAGLYNYTPYLPNKAALNAGYGTAKDACSSYGNRNFYNYFTDWFGSTLVKRWSKMEIPRYLIASSDTYKLNPVTMEPVTSQKIAKNTLVKYTSKTRLDDNSLCLRTEANTKSDSQLCVKMSELEETIWIPMATPRKMLTREAGYVIDAVTVEELEPFETYALEEFSTKTILEDGRSCLRTPADTAENANRCVLLDALFTPPTQKDFKNMVTPRSFSLRANVKKINVTTGKRGELLPENKIVFFEKSIRLDGKLCLRTKSDTKENKATCIFYDDLIELMSIKDFGKMTEPRKLKLKSDVTKIDITTGKRGGLLPDGKLVDFAMRIEFDGKLCLRTKSDTKNNKPTCIFYEDLY